MLSCLVEPARLRTTKQIQGFALLPPAFTVTI